jgi:EAL domain-containing protein (putative c-di-GMP-specific phosphodiesterase class I)
VVAEGIEERDQMAMLEEMGCEMAQGFLMGRPDTAEIIERMLGARAASPTAASPAR